MNDTAVIVVLLALLASSHMLLSSRTVRPRLVARLGETRFLVAYSLVALVFFVPLFYQYFTHRHAGPQLWAVPDSEAVGLLLGLANTAGLVMLVAGLVDPAPASFVGKPRDAPSGVYRITRHPIFMGVTVMAIAHVVANGHATDIASFGGLGVFALAGCRHQDLRKLAGGDPTYRRFHAATSLVPFKGIRSNEGWRSRIHRRAGMTKIGKELGQTCVD